MNATNKSMIAVVDDDNRVLESIQDLLESVGHAVCLFSSSRTLLEGDALKNINCLVTDIGLPEIDGFELHRLVRMERPKLPIIFVTARTEAAIMRRAAAVSHHGVFRKPFDGRELLAAIDRALSTSSEDQ